MADVKVTLTEIQASIVREALELHAATLGRALEAEQSPTVRYYIEREIAMSRDLQSQFEVRHG